MFVEEGKRERMKKKGGGKTGKEHDSARQQTGPTGHRAGEASSSKHITQEEAKLAAGKKTSHHLEGFQCPSVWSGFGL